MSQPISTFCAGRTPVSEPDITTFGISALRTSLERMRDVRRLPSPKLEQRGKPSMSYEVITKTVGAQPLAAVRRRVCIGDVGRAWKSALDLVWEFLRRHDGLRTDGHNCFLYHHPANREGTMDVDFGVQVIHPFRDEGEVVCTETPPGEVAMTTHIGSYAGLGAAHDAIQSWRAATGRAFGACSWEVYGDWTDDEAKLETQIVYLLI
jgi:effector-binding domain-containing protein